VGAWLVIDSTLLSIVNSRLLSTLTGTRRLAANVRNAAIADVAKKEKLSFNAGTRRMPNTVGLSELGIRAAGRNTCLLCNLADSFGQ
jgi:hypothetical protein